MGLFDKLREVLISQLDNDSPAADSPEENASSYRQWTGHAGGYYVCSHMGCSKKINPTITDHDCCGRCSTGRSCLIQAIDNYVGPGTFAHPYWETIVSPGVCGTCGETDDAH